MARGRIGQFGENDFAARVLVQVVGERATADVDDLRTYAVFRRLQTMAQRVGLDRNLGRALDPKVGMLWK